ncbi:MAG TPA: glycerol-3-phosphate 1-O-acyltransferase PlsY [Gaiellaceae bacterium]|nr:glycerol-3-phosphate 1-O-acyltransferase PlsY [Gaiellaceae bacterium]
MLEIALIVAGGYLLGSMPFGYWVVRLFRHEDIRQVGSGNIGTTNVWRSYGRRLGIPVVLLDVAKGTAPALTGTLLVSHWVGILAGAAAMVGHWRPLFLGFAKGGKTVATYGGVLWGLAPLVALCGAVVWLLLFLGLRYASVASMVAAASLPLIAFGLGEPWPVDAFAAVAALAVVVLHRANIRRLVRGQENRFRFRRLPTRV